MGKRVFAKILPMAPPTGIRVVEVALGVSAWDRLRAVARLSGLPNSPPALRTDRTDSQPEELLLESAFRARDAAAWVAELRAFLDTLGLTTATKEF